MMLIFLSVVVIVVVLIRHPVVKGIIGEFVVRIILGQTSEKEGKEKYVINNFLIELENGKTSQTDHVLINQNGVFVIETKNYSGRIYGNDFNKEWTQVLNYGKVKNKFYSPVKQNAVHVHYIKELLPIDTPVHSVVVFIKGNIGYINSAYVYDLWGLFNLVKSPSEDVLSFDQMTTINNILLQNNKSSEISNFEHVQNIKRTQEDISNNICPRCGGTLVRREGKNGYFWGCSNYPKCKFTKKYYLY